jgi:hypothetical protein
MGISLSCFASHQTVAERDLCRVVPIFQWASLPAHQAEFRPTFKGAYTQVHSARMGWCSAGWQALGEFFPAIALGRGRIELQMSAQVRCQVVRLLRHLLAYGPKVIAEEGSPDTGFDLAAFVGKRAPELLARLSETRHELKATDFDASFDDVLKESFEYAYEAAVHGRLYVSDFGRLIRPMEFAVIHEDAYLALVERKLSTPQYGRPPVDVQTAISTAFEEARRRHPDGQSSAASLKYVRASTVADKLLQISDLTRNLFLLQSHLQDIALAVFDEELSEDSAAKLLRTDIENVYAFACLDDLGLPLSPVVYAADEDYDNHCGNAYLEFVTKVNRRVHRSRSVALHGPWHQYELRAATMDDIEQLKEEAKTWDAGFELVSVNPVQGSGGALLKVVFNVTAELEYVARVLGLIEVPLMHESLKLVV